MYNEDKKVKIKKSSKENEDFLSKFFRKRTKRLLTNLDKLFRKIMWIEIGISAFLVLLGTIFLIFPDFSLTVMSIIFGLGVLVFGGLNIYSYLKRKEIPLFRFHLGYGILGVILGLSIIIMTIVIDPLLLSQIVTIFIGIWILYLAIVKIDLALRLKTISEKSWLLLLVSALLEIFMSILIFINPFSNLLITQTAGAYFILCGILNGMDAILTKNRAIDFLENL